MPAAAYTPGEAIEPGQVVMVDHRPKLCTATGLKPPVTPLKVLQWNIERGYQLDRILATLRAESPDIAVLQELDLGCERSGGTDQLDIIARSLGWQGAFVAEFAELHSSRRSARDQGGGYHGNAVFSRFPIVAAHVVSHRYQPVDWNAPDTDVTSAAHRYREPRRGQRYTLAAVVQPDACQYGAPAPPVLVYSAHLEVFCGLSHRVCQFAEILDDAHRHQRQYPHQLLFGDLNTMAHSWARLSPKYCQDQFRWRSLGTSEPRWWYNHVLSVARPPLPGPTAATDGGLSSDEKWATQAMISSPSPTEDLVSVSPTGHDDDIGAYDSPLAPYGPTVFPPDVQRMARNPGFQEPWDIDQDFTLRSLHGFYQAKLDWTFYTHFTCVGKHMGNDDYEASDHKYLALQLAYQAAKL
ncbi:hypothetical protein IWQ60_009040 [Tieghemiomyces parasiticus]|uniref:Endonuclease/exonuclease/phosphatase domain-containing protein n=1 Tax=Tieghemiomyces parasiticus TaxID=78921 RepID=A0A9W7ZUG6_9FUNG|nr:hypothetical protein IWQ60_009040 [Tieghemiomyces parasiticus]